MRGYTPRAGTPDPLPRPDPPPLLPEDRGPAAGAPIRPENVRDLMRENDLLRFFLAEARWCAEDARSGMADLIGALAPQGNVVTPQQAMELNWPFPWEVEE